jgi:glycopeptide antibiotics resistance protein
MTLEISFFAGELIYTVFYLTVRVITALCRKKIDWKREAHLLILYVYLAVLIRFTFYPFFRADGKVQPLLLDTQTMVPLRVNLKPFVQLLWFETKQDLLLNLIGNVCMFIPCGIILPALFRKMDSFLKVTAAGAGISIRIEILQLPFAARASDIDDVILNTLGVVAGYAIYKVFNRITTG